MMVMVSAMSVVVMTVPACVGAAFRLEGQVLCRHGEVHGPQHVGQHVVGLDLEVIGLQLDRHVAVAQVVGGAGQVECGAMVGAVGDDQHGRDRSGPRFGDRPLDIDIVFYDDLVLEGAGHLQLPRDELKHAFVLKPLAEIAPEFVDPRSGRTLAALWADSSEREVPFVPAFDPNVGE